jgi:hypothetical protein
MVLVWTPIANHAWKMLSLRQHSKERHLIYATPSIMQPGESLLFYLLKIFVTLSLVYFLTFLHPMSTLLLPGLYRKLWRIPRTTQLAGSAPLPPSLSLPKLSLIKNIKALEKWPRMIIIIMP